MYQDSSTSDPFTLPTLTHPPKRPKPNKFLFRSVVGLAVISGVLIITKPSKTNYDSYIATTFVAELQQAYCNGISLPKEMKVVGDLGTNFCKFSIASGTTIIGDDRLQTFASNSSVCNSYAIFSICSTEIPGKKITKLGILRQFFPLPN